MITPDKIEEGLRALFGRLVAYKVDWAFADRFDGAHYEPGADRQRTTIESANVVSSQLQEFYLKPKDGGRVDLFAEDLLEPQRHVVALDLDIPAYLVPSATEGHSHLYIDVPGGVDHDDYMELLGLLGRIGVIEEGYAAVSVIRGHTDLRLPWVAKEPRRERPVSRCCRCLEEGSTLNEYVMQTWGEKGEGAAEPTPEEVEDYIWANEGTLNRQSGLFACTACYIAMGQPSSPRGWTPPGPDSIQPF